MRCLGIDVPGVPFCDQRDGLVSVIHPIDRAGMWCTACMQAATATARNERHRG